MTIRPGFDERVSALRARAEAIRAAIWYPLANTGVPGSSREPADLVVSGMIVALMLVAVSAGLF